MARWDEDGNGEIYTERASNVESSDVINGLYVVENGREYRLVSLQERMKMFEKKNGRAKRKSREEKEIEINVPIPAKVNNASDDQKVMTHPENVLKAQPVDVSKPQPVNTSKAQPVNSIGKSETIKCNNLPYILEEREILQNIDIVRNVKNMFFK